MNWDMSERGEAAKNPNYDLHALVAPKLKHFGGKNHYSIYKCDSAPTWRENGISNVSLS